MEYEVVYSYTLDHITWTCPNCNTQVEETSFDDNQCPNCQFEREGLSMGETYDETETYEIEEN